MNLIEIKAERSILLDQDYTNKKEENLSFLVALSKHSKATIGIEFASKKIEIKVNNYPVSDEFVSNENLDFDDLSKNLQKEITDIKSELTALVINVLSLIKYH